MHVGPVAGGAGGDAAEGDGVELEVGAVGAEARVEEVWRVTEAGGGAVGRVVLLHDPESAIS